MAATDISDRFRQQYELDGWTNILAAFTALEGLVNGLRTHVMNQVLNNPVFTLVSNFDVKNDEAIQYLNGGVLKTPIAADQTWNTGTAQIIAIDKWSSALLSIAANATLTVTWSETLDAASEAAAIAALPAIPAGHTPAGYITVKTGDGVTWTAGTDALKTGTGGTPAAETNYYNSVNPDAMVIPAAFSAATYLQA